MNNSACLECPPPLPIRIQRVNVTVVGRDVDGPVGADHRRGYIDTHMEFEGPFLLTGVGTSIDGAEVGVPDVVMEHWPRRHSQLRLRRCLSSRADDRKCNCSQSCSHTNSHAPYGKLHSVLRDKTDL
jgi:hypothetical protein